MGNVGFFACPPWWFRNHFGVRASVYNRYHSIPEAAANLLACGCASLVFNCVVEQGGYRFIFISAIFKNNASDCQQVSDIRDGCSLAGLLRMQPCCKDERFLEACRKWHERNLFFISKIQRDYSMFSSLLLAACGDEQKKKKRFFGDTPNPAKGRLPL